MTSTSLAEEQVFTVQLQVLSLIHAYSESNWNPATHLTKQIATIIRITSVRIYYCALILKTVLI